MIGGLLKINKMAHTTVRIQVKNCPDRDKLCSENGKRSTNYQNGASYVHGAFGCENPGNMYYSNVNKAYKQMNSGKP